MRSRFRLLLLALSAAIVARPAVVLADDWIAATPEELQMTSEPKAPGASAIYLDHIVVRNDASSWQSEYFRIKILTEAGRKLGSVRIVYYDGQQRVTGIEARTVHPDGSIVPFDGVVYDGPIEQSYGYRLLSKIFTIPDVDVGNIVEYRFRYQLNADYVFNSYWLLNDNLFTRHGQYTLYPRPYFSLIWSWPNGLPEGSGAPEKRNRRIELETHDVPGFVTEDYMPPPDALRQRVDFNYWTGRAPSGNFDEFWNDFAEKENQSIDAFIDHPRAVTAALAQIIAPTDTPEMKLRKIYARVQSLRNLSFESEKTTQEVRREDLKPIGDVGDLWERGYGNSRQLNLLFLALARAAGFDANPVLLSPRSKFAFAPRALNPSPLTITTVRITVGGGEKFFDPAMIMLPYGMLPWGELASPGLLLTKAGGSWTETPVPAAADSSIEHSATLHLAADGSLEGNVTVKYTGIAALSIRFDERREDAAARKRFLEEQLEHDIPTGCDVDLVNQPDWDSSATDFVAEYHLTIPGWLTAAAGRGFIPSAVFTGAAKNMFAPTTRVHPIFFRYPYRQLDNVTISLPATYRVRALPDTQNIDNGAFRYFSASERSTNGVHQLRDFEMNGVTIPVKYYDKVRDFFQGVRNQDEQQVGLELVVSKPSH